MRRLTLRRVGACVRALLADPDTATARQASDDGWSTTDHLLALILDELRVANWQRSGKRSNRPKPMSPLAKRHGKTKQWGNTDRPAAEVAAVLARYGPQGAEPAI